MPGKFVRGDGWRLEHDWQRFCERLPTNIELGFWEKWPDANVGIALGPASGGEPGVQLVALDLDTDDRELSEAIITAAGASPVRKRGRKGQTLFYRASLAVVNRSFNIGRDRVLDLLAKGRQTVLPPSIHPATGEPYVWLTLDTLESFPVADLPELPDDIADRLASALAPFGVECAGGASVTIATRVNLDGSESPHRALNEKALANLEAWVPALKLYGCERHNGGFRAVAHWRASGSGRPLHKRNPNLSILPEGIRDFGLDGKGYTPLDVVMAATDADLDMAFKWLQDRVDARAAWSAWSDFEGPKKNRERSPEKRPETAAEPEAVSAEAEADEGAQAAENPAPEPTPEPEAANDDEPPAVPGLFPAELLDPPGLVGDLVRWMNAASEKPSPTLNLGAALAFLGAVMGQRFESETEARTNVYIVGVAPTAFGKSYPLKAISRVMTEGGFQAFRGPADFKSDGGIRKLLEQKKTCVACIDEMGGFLKRVLDRKAAAHDRRIRDMLLALFSAANDVYQGSEGAAERAVEIINPNLCIFGASTPEDFWSAFSSGNVSDGLLPRFLIFDAGRKRPATVDPTADPKEPPEAVVKGIRAVLAARPKGGNLDTRPIVARYGVGAKEWFSALRREMEARADKATGIEQAVVSRVAEHTIKLALIVAVGCAPSAPVITVEHLMWARGVVDCSSAAILSAVEGRIADNDRQAEYLMVLGIIRDAGKSGILRSQLLRQIRGLIDLRRFGDIVSQLKEAKEIDDGVITPLGGGRPGARLWVLDKEQREAS